jgi:hypothetical protein
VPPARARATPEKALDRALNEMLKASPQFVTWLLDRTKFAGRGGIYTWSRADNPWCKMSVDTPTGQRAVESETDILAVFTDAHGIRLGIHIENKRGTGRFRSGQPVLYAKRAAFWVGNPSYGSYTEYTTLLVAPREFQRRCPEESALFEAFISHEDLASHIPLFAGAPNKSLERTRAR